MSKVGFQGYSPSLSGRSDPGPSTPHAWQGLITDVAVNGENLPSRVHWSLGSTLCLAFVSSAVLWGVIIAGANLLLRAIA